MRKILCPTDFSDAANNAIAYAAKLAQTLGAELTLFHVHSLFDVSFAEWLREGKNTHEVIIGALERQCFEVSALFRIPCNAEIRESGRMLSDAISREAGSFDLLVMGTNGPDDLYQFFAGSNAYNAVIHSRTLAMIIPENYMYAPITRITVAFDYLRKRRLPEQQLAALHKLFHADITILQVLEEAQSTEVEEELEELQFILGGAMQKNQQVAFETIKSSDIATSMHEHFLAHSPDAVALCTAHRNMIGRIFHTSVVKRVTALAQYPVIVFHE